MTVSGILKLSKLWLQPPFGVNCWRFSLSLSLFSFFSSSSSYVEITLEAYTYFSTRTSSTSGNCASLSFQHHLSALACASLSIDPTDNFCINFITIIIIAITTMETPQVIIKFLEEDCAICHKILHNDEILAAAVHCGKKASPSSVCFPLLPLPFPIPLSINPFHARIFRLDSISPQWLTSLGHCFHYSCLLAAWATRQLSTCPLCRLATADTPMLRLGIKPINLAEKQDHLSRLTVKLKDAGQTFTKLRSQLKKSAERLLDRKRQYLRDRVKICSFVFELRVVVGHLISGLHASDRYLGT